MTVLTPPGYVQGGTYTAKLDRVYLGTLGRVPNLAASFSARQGFFNGRVPVYANPSGMNITIGACGAIIANTFASASGDYLVANDATVQVTLAAASATLNRYDIIGFQVKDNIFDASGLNTAVPAVIQGSNSAGTPSDPALPASFIPVLRAVVNATNTSPASLQSLIRKTTEDGGLLRVANPTERAEITPHQGMSIYREDKGWIEVHDGTAWRVQGTQTVSALADITDPKVGQLAVLSTDLVMYRWTGSAWLGVAHTAVNGGHAKYNRTTAQANAFVANTWVRQAYNVAINTTPDVAANGSFDQFTLNRSGTWSIDASTRAGTTNLDPMRYQLGVFPGAAPGSSAYKVTTENEPLASSNSTNLSVAVTRRFAAGDSICIAARRSGNSGAGGGNDAPSEANSTDEGWVQLDLRWIGP